MRMRATKRVLADRTLAVQAVSQIRRIMGFVDRGLEQDREDVMRKYDAIRAAAENQERQRLIALYAERPSQHDINLQSIGNRRMIPEAGVVLPAGENVEC